MKNLVKELRELTKEHNLLMHGSSKKISRFILPRKSIIGDNQEKVVCATDDPRIAILRALMPRKKMKFLTNQKPENIDVLILEGRKLNEYGWIHLVPTEVFLKKNTCFISENPVAPCKIIRVDRIQKIEGLQVRHL